MFEGYLLEAEKHLAAVKMELYFYEKYRDEEAKREAAREIKALKIVIRDLIEELR
jgi:hypothetical protein